MIIKGEFIFAKFLSRINRFVGEIFIDGRKELVHIADPGRLGELAIPGNDVVVMKVPQKPSRKLSYELIAFRENREWIFTNSRYHRKIAEELFQNGVIPELSGLSVIPEYRTGKSRIDFALTNTEKWLVEIKGCTLAKDNIALFPDAPTTRGKRHIFELIRAFSAGWKAMVIFLVMIPWVTELQPNIQTDPDFSHALEIAYKQGIKIRAVKFRTTVKSNTVKIQYLSMIPVNIP